MYIPPEIWGINGDGTFTRSQQNTRNTILSNVRRSIVGGKHDLVGDIIIEELKEMHRSLIAEQNNFVDPAVTDREKSKRLLFLFQLDLLGGGGGIGSVSQ